LAAVASVLLLLLLLRLGKVRSPSRVQ